MGNGVSPNPNPRALSLVTSEHGSGPARVAVHLTVSPHRDCARAPTRPGCLVT